MIPRQNGAGAPQSPCSDEGFSDFAVWAPVDVAPPRDGAVADSESFLAESFRLDD